MATESPEPREILCDPAQRMIGKCSPVRAVKWWPEMPRAGVNIGKRSLELQPKTRNISGANTRGGQRRGRIK
jgi:hypothetical protein